MAVPALASRFRIIYKEKLTLVIDQLSYTNGYFSSIYKNIENVENHFEKNGESDH